MIPDAIRFLRRSFPNATIVKWAADVRDNPSPHDTELLKAGVDWFFGTFGGEYLKKHLMPGMTGVGSIFTFTDSSYYKPQEVDEQYLSDVLWTGRRGFGDNRMRNEIIDSLYKTLVTQSMATKSEIRQNIKLFGHDGKTWLGDPDYVRYINGTRIGIGSNSFNRRLYSSDRLGNYMACGTFYLAQYIEGMELVFDRGIDLDWFTSIDDMHNRIKFYLENEQLRNVIAQRGRLKVLQLFDCKPLTMNLLNIIKTQSAKHPWEDVFIQSNSTTK